MPKRKAYTAKLRRETVEDREDALAANRALAEMRREGRKPLSLDEVRKQLKIDSSGRRHKG